MTSSTDEIFQKWLLTHHIGYKDEATNFTFDADIFKANNYSPILVQQRTFKHYHVDSKSPHPQSFISPQTMATIESHLDELEKYSVEKHRKITTDAGEPLIESIKTNGKGDFEPVWSDTKIQDPAEMFLPTEHKLMVEEIQPTIEKLCWFELYDHFLGFKNNLFRIHGKYAYIARENIIEIHDLDSFNDTTKKDPVIVLSMTNWFKHIDRDIVINIDDALFQTDSSENRRLENMTMSNQRRYIINYIKISNFLGRDVLCVCTSYGLTLLYDLKLLEMEYSTISQMEPPHKYSVHWNFPFAKPLAVFKVPESCWSVDILAVNENLTFVAMGHNGRAICLFAYDGESQTSLSSINIPTKHNVPSLNFVQSPADRDDNILLSYSSIYGNVGTIKIKTKLSDNGKIIIDHYQSQFLGEHVWTVTPLKKKDFLSVPKFEMLNLNFQTNFKKSILYSVVMDSTIITNHLPNFHYSNQLGIGAMTTQVPVPVSNLGLRCIEGIRRERVDLRFTTFDAEGEMSSANIIQEQERVYPEPLTILNRRNELRTIERVNLNFPRDPIQHFYFGFNKWSNNSLCLNDEARNRYEKWWDSKFVINFPLNSNTIHMSTQPFKFTSLKEEISNIKYKSNRIHDLVSKEFGYLGYENVAKDLYKDINPIIAILQSEDTLDTNYSIDNTENLTVLDTMLVNNLVIDPNIPTVATDTNIDPDDHTDSLIMDNPHHYDSQLDWALHNHVQNVRRLIEVESNEEEPLRNDDNFLFVTTATKVYLMKTDPLMISSFTADDIFPVSTISVCNNHDLIDAMNRINFICFIKELNCIVIASQVGLVSLLRLTEYNGIFSFRQEYILGWHSQDPENHTDDDNCMESIINNDPQRWICDIDDVSFPFFDIVGLDYSYIPYDEVNNYGDYAILYVHSQNTLRRFRISTGETTFK